MAKLFRAMLVERYRFETFETTCPESELREALERAGREANVEVDYWRTDGSDIVECTISEYEDRRRADELTEVVANALADHTLGRLRTWGKELSPSGYDLDAHCNAMISAGKASPDCRRFRFDLDSALCAVTRRKERLLRLLGQVLDADLDYRGRGASSSRLEHIVVKRDADALIVESAEDAEMVFVVIRALLSPSIHRFRARRRIDGWPPRAARYWAPGVLTVATLSVFAAPLPLSRAVVVGFASACVMIAATSVAAAKRAGLQTWPVLRGLLIPLVVVAFGVGYAFAMLGEQPYGVTAAHSSMRLVEPLMLSLGVATTAGFLDFTLRSEFVRFAAYMEMLAVVSVAGGSLYSAGREFWHTMRRTLLVPE